MKKAKSKGENFIGAIIGMKNSGKTTLLKNMLLYAYKDCFDLIVVISPTWAKQKDLWQGKNSIDGRSGIVIFTNLNDNQIEAIKKTFEKIYSKTGKVVNTLLILDDTGFFLRDNSQSAQALDRFVLIARHYNCSIIYSCQVFSQMSPSFRKQLNWLVSFAQNNNREILALWTEFQPAETNTFHEFQSLMQDMPEYSYVVLENKNGRIHSSSVFLPD